MSDAIDFSSASLPPARNVHYDIEAAETVPQPSLTTRHTFNSSGDLSDHNAAPILKRHSSRATTSRTFRAINAYPVRPQWHAGQEPGLDPAKKYGGRSTKPMPHAACDITVVDFSEDDMVMRHLDNSTLPEWIAKEGNRDDWIKCRWINVNGLSWDVIQELGKYKKLHRLAVEDMINTKNRTKADWYSDHTYIVLTLQKLVHLHNDSVSDSDNGSENEGSVNTAGESRKRKATLKKMIKNLFSRSDPTPGSRSSSKPFDTTDEPQGQNNIFVTAHTEGETSAPIQKLRTLQRYHGSVNAERLTYMEENSALTKKDLAVCAEQVSIFLMADNTVISFFESSAEDVEIPILSRLSTPDTILRRSCDASMLTQSIIDAIIDLAIPVATAYQDVIGDLELDVLTEPDIKHTKDLYIITSEITTMRNFVTPIASLVAALREHKSESIGVSMLQERGMNRNNGVKITAMTQTYLGDVEDHCVLINQTLDQMHGSAAGMIDLIFNTISAYQNESMKQLTVVTILFLPLTFITGYFGMNFTGFAAIENTESYFWQIAIPVSLGTAIFLMRDVIWRWIVKTSQRRGISRRRKWRLKREAEASKTR